MVTSVESKMKSGDFCRILKKSNFMNKQEHYLRSPNISDEEEVGLVDRWILACLVKGLQGKSKISKISLDKIAEYCRYTNEQGKEARFGVKTIQASIDRLEASKMVKVIKPIKRGQCTQYEIKDIKSYEKINDDFFNLDLSPAAKGYILCMLQHNLNKDEDTHQPNDMHTKTTYNVTELANKFHTPVSTIYKAEKSLKDLGILTVENDPKQRRDQETGLIIQHREIDLQKIGLDVFVQILIKQQEQIDQKADKKDVEDLKQLVKHLQSQINHMNAPTPINFE